MAEKLVTIAEYLEPVEADMMRNRLEEQGIRAVLDNIGVVSMAWYLSQAVGGIKLLVFEEDAKAAREILADMQDELAEARRLTAAAAEEQKKELDPQLAKTETEGEEDQDDDSEDGWWNVESADEPALLEDASPWTPPRAIDPPAAQAANLTREAADKDPPPRNVEDEDSEELPVYNGREQLAWKAFRTAVLGYYMLPLQFYASYLIIKVLLDLRPLQAKVKQKLKWAIWLNGFFWFACCFIVFLIFSRDLLEEIQYRWYMNRNKY